MQASKQDNLANLEEFMGTGSPMPPRAENRRSITNIEDVVGSAVTLNDPQATPTHGLPNFQNPIDDSSSKASKKDKEDGQSLAETVTSKEPGEDAVPFKADWRIYSIFLMLCVITAASALDATSISTALPVITAALHGTAVEAYWAGTSFLISSSVLMPLFASLSHIFGRKPLIFVGLTLFATGAIMGALAKNFTVLLIGRVIQGIGGGGMSTLSEIIVTDLIPLRERGKFFGFISMMWAVGSVSGPLLGGGFAGANIWPWIFWINLPFIGIAFIMVPLFLHLNFVQSSTMAKLRRVDWIGAVIFVGSSTSFLIPLAWGGSNYPWSSWRTLVPLLIGAAGLIGFIFYEIYVATEPMIRMKIFTQRTAAANYIGVVMHGIILWCLLYYLPAYYEAVKGQTPILAGVSIFPETFTVAPASVVVGIMVSVRGTFRGHIWIGWFLTTLGMGLLYLLDVHTSTPAWIFLNLVSGLGTGILFPSMAFAIQAAVSNEDVAYAVAMMAFLRTFGQAFGVAIGGTIFSNALKSKLTAIPSIGSAAGQFSKDAIGLIAVIKDMPQSPEKVFIIQAYADALKIVWISMVGFAVIGGIASLWTEDLSLNRVHETQQGLKTKVKAVDAEAAKTTLPVDEK